MNKLTTSKEMAGQVFDGATIVVNGFIMVACADDILFETEQRFIAEGSPKNLDIIAITSVGDGPERGINRLAKKGMIHRIIAGHYNFMQKLHPLILNNEIEAYNFPQDCIGQLIRESGSRRPGLITKIGLDTFVDPRLEGGKLNEITTEDLCSVINIDDEEYLHYKPIKKIDFAFLKGTYADKNGNVSCEKEASLMDCLTIAASTHNLGGKVFVQVEKIVDKIPPHSVKIPGIFVDGIALARPQFHMQTALSQYNPSYCGEKYVEVIPWEYTGEKGIIVGRAAQELREHSIINLGVGIPDGIGHMAVKNEVSDVTLTIDAGSIGGTPATGADFGVCLNPEAIIFHHQLFDFYNGGGLNQAFLGLAEVDAKGNINVSKFGSKIAGCGGFTGITQSAQKLYFMGTFTASGLITEIKDGKLNILQEGKIKKFKNRIQQQTFSAKRSFELNQEVMFITERCVLVLKPEGLVLTEIAPGVDLEKDIFANMEFTPVVSKDLRLMDGRFFA